MAKDSTKNKNKVPKGIPVAFPAAMGLMAAYLKLVRHLHLDRSGIKGLKPPYVVISNHQSMVDFGAVFAACRPNDVTFVVSSHYFHNPLFSKLLKAGGCISKRQFYPDTAAIRQIIRVIKSGGVIGIFPEGQTCWSGRSNEIDRSIGKLVKSLGVPVVNVKIRGNYLAAPKWADGRSFPGYTCAKAELLLSAEQVASMDAEALADRIIEDVEYNEYDWQRQMMIPNRKRTPKGLERYLWRCPNCGEEFTISCEDDKLVCSSCGLTLSMDQYGFLHSSVPGLPDTPPELLDMQSEALKRQLEEGTILPLKFKARWFESAPGEIETNGYREYGYGEVTVDKDGLHYSGTRAGEEHTFSTSPRAQWNLTHNYNIPMIDLAGNTPEPRDYGLSPDNPQMLLKVIQLWPLIRKKYYE